MRAAHPHEHRGVRATNWSRSVTHVIVGQQCQTAEKQRILQYADMQGDVCRMVYSSWLHACDQVCSVPQGTLCVTCLLSHPPRVDYSSVSCCSQMQSAGERRDSRKCTLQAQMHVDESAHAVDLDTWKTECGANVPASQACNLLAGKSFYLDALIDEQEKRQAKEFVPQLGRTRAF